MQPSNEYMANRKQHKTHKMIYIQVKIGKCDPPPPPPTPPLSLSLRLPPPPPPPLHQPFHFWISVCLEVTLNLHICRWVSLTDMRPTTDMPQGHTVMIRWAQSTALSFSLLCNSQAIIARNKGKHTIITTMISQTHHTIPIAMNTNSYLSTTYSLGTFVSQEQWHMAVDVH